MPPMTIQTKGNRGMARADQLASMLHTAVAGELRHIRAVLEQLAELLVADEHFVTNYVDQLQTFDLLIQCADESAAVLDRIAGGIASHEAIAPVRLSMVRDRLHAALAKAA